MKPNSRYILASLAAAALFSSCEQVISPRLQQANPVVVVDAWINNQQETQKIYLYESQPYFDNSTPQPLTGASVLVVNQTQSKTYTFSEAPGGAYLWTPAVADELGVAGDQFSLAIQYGGQTFSSVSRMGRVPAIDSITFKKDKRIGTGTEIFLGEFWATDPVGGGDTYWIRTTKNGTLLNKPSELVLAYDAGFSAGSLTDGVTFISPIRTGINPNETAQNGKEPPSPYTPGDSVHVRIYSITLAAFNFLTEVSTQTNRPGGFAELFSTPLANVSTNITTSGNQSGAVGFFNVSAVSQRGQKFVPKP
ncbi:MAG: DUF4249 domain-containing protein [Cyclobacteriaceae bacterium]|nr:DUF4249 domain-containing protein [Cyclobacteriaceae bacterium]